MKKYLIHRLNNKYLYADIIKIGNIYIRIGTFPGISKYLNKIKIYPQYTVVLPPLTSIAGDNYTGEDFVLLNKYYKKDLSPIYYIGYKYYVKYLYKRSKNTLNQTFNKHKTKIITKNRLKKLFKPILLKPNSFYNISDKIRINTNISNVQIYNKNNLIYDWIEKSPTINIRYEAKKMLSPYKNKKKVYLNNSINILPIGVGNGFHGECSNFIIQYADRTIWVDPMVQPFIALKKAKLHWNMITDYLITHIHEDHIEGLSSVLKYSLLNNYKINLITTQKIYQQLKNIFSFLFPDFIYLVNHINVIPDTTLPYHHGYLTVRLNHHPVKSGTLGLKIRYRDNCFALSGDNHYSEEFEAKYPNNSAFDSKWYSGCQLLFHEVDFFNPDTIHTYYKEIIKLQQKLKIKILCYHNSSNKSLLPMVKPLKKYIIKNKKVFIF